MLIRRWSEIVQGGLILQRARGRGERKCEEEVDLSHLAAFVDI